MWTDPTTPNAADFLSFVLEQGVPGADLPANSPYPGLVMNMALARVVGADTSDPIEYVLAVYNLGMHLLCKMSQDQVGQTFFSDTRKAMKLTSFRAGLVLASGDGPTSETFDVPDWVKRMSLRDLDLINSPWGREYMGYMQMYGPHVTVMV